MAFTQWTAGTKITAAKLAAMTPVWATWTPTWTTSGTAAPTFGNATLACRYCQSGDLVVAIFDVTFGSTTSFSTPTTDNWRFSLPETAATTDQLFLGAFELGVGTTTKCAAKARISTTDTFGLEIMTGRVDGASISASGEVDGASPETWASGDTLKGQLIYPAA